MLGVVRTRKPKACGLFLAQQTHLIFLAGERGKIADILETEETFFQPLPGEVEKVPKTSWRLAGHHPMLLGARMMNEPSPPFSQACGDQPSPEKCHIAHKQVSPSRFILCRTSLRA